MTLTDDLEQAAAAHDRNDSGYFKREIEIKRWDGETLTLPRHQWLENLKTLHKNIYFHTHWNYPVAYHDPTANPEIIVLRQFADID